MPDALTERGQTVGEIYDTIVILGLIVFVIVFVWLVVVIWRFRETTGHGRATHERERHNIKAELAWFLIPLAIVLYIGGIAYAGLVELDHGIDPKDVAPENHIRITGSQWTWAAEYPGMNGAPAVVVRSDPDPITGAVKNESVFLVPQDTPLLFNVTASDVIHAFQVLDANHAFVIFIDANPLGAHQFNTQTASLPGGEYYVQCNKMCLNPGHAIMRARIKAVPQADFDHWLKERQASAGAAVVNTFALKATDKGLVGGDGKAAGPFTVAVGSRATRIIIDLAPPTQEITLSAPGEAPKTFARGEAVDTFYAFDVTGAGNVTLEARSGDKVVGSVVFMAVSAQNLQVELGPFRLVPEHISLKAGTTYLITLPNTHTTVHDLYIGHYNGGGAASEVLAKSSSVGPGGQGAFIVTVEETGEFDMWCNQPGHVGQGMIGSVSVA